MLLCTVAASVRQMVTKAPSTKRRDDSKPIAIERVGVRKFIERFEPARMPVYFGKEMYRRKSEEEVGMERRDAILVVVFELCCNVQRYAGACRGVV